MMLLELPLSTRILLTKQFATSFLFRRLRPLIFAAAWLMLLISEPPDMTWITLSWRGGEAGLVSADFLGVSLLKRFSPFLRGIHGDIPGHIPPSCDHGHGGTHTRDKCEISGQVDTDFPSALSRGRLMYLPRFLPP
ncbi:hypothetical protein DY000_02031486 [Brassica cretica]|uniref:Uncharacterized protein n=1 Tax=Brassica cretica TaxID=69181 RepID=A0ABQ7DNZ7_BRACR|nr:hypothetical protein DY000_02031486 [Brassica cretica]